LQGFAHRCVRGSQVSPGVDGRDVVVDSQAHDCTSLKWYDRRKNSENSSLSLLSETGKKTLTFFRSRLIHSRFKKSLSPYRKSLKILEFILKKMRKIVAMAIKTMQ
ncbi:MAG: hypothetical protein GY866_25470, partial [Proteobacteria bacterium]|nr:hypothetical protein [Pseudomonadota bacterium]